MLVTQINSKMICKAKFFKKKLKFGKWRRRDDRNKQKLEIRESQSRAKQRLRARSTKKGKEADRKRKNVYQEKTTKQERKTKGDSKKGRALSRIRTTHLRLDATSPQPRQWNLDLTNLSITKFSVKRTISSARPKLQ